MFNYWIRNRAFLGFLLALISVCFAIFVFVLPANTSVNSSYKENSLEMNSDISYQIPSPGSLQLEKMKNQNLIEDAFPYYFTETTAVIGNKKREISFLMTDSSQNLECTMYSSNRLLAGENQVNKNKALIDYSFAKNNGLKIGDEFSVNLASSSFVVSVAGIFEDNTIFQKPVVLCEFNGSQKEIYMNAVSHLSYSGAFIKSSSSAIQDYLNSYIPEGKYRDRKEFSSDESYQSYNDAVKAGNYSREIAAFSSSDALNRYKQVCKKSRSMIFIGAALLCFIIIIEELILSFRKSESKYFEILENRKDVRNYHIYSFIEEIFVSLVSCILLLKMLSLSVDFYLPKNYLNFGLCSLCFSIIVGHVLSFFISTRIDKSQEKRIAEKTQNDEQSKI